MRSIIIGVLALQGDFAKHVEMLHSLGIETIEVRKPEDLKRCDGLILPGGESTVIGRGIERIGLEKPLIQFASQKPVFGTCAGLILMSQQIENTSIQSLKLLDVKVERNAYGRQDESFQAFIDLALRHDHSKRFPAYFIRAPRIRSIGTHVQILAVLANEPILVQQGHHLGASFHPELTNDPDIHLYFLSLVKENLLATHE